jgi:ferredoxin
VIEMPIVLAAGRAIDCAPGAKLREVLLKAGIDLHAGPAKVVNCRGIGSCGTCAVAIEGPVSEPNWRETARLRFPPHSAIGPAIGPLAGILGPQPSSQGLRLACQVRVLGDISVTKYDGFWGQNPGVYWSATEGPGQSAADP